MRRDVWEITFPSPIGLGADVPGNEAALGGLARFGVGFVEVGPVSQAPTSTALLIDRRPLEQAIWLPEPTPGADADTLLVTIERSQPLPIPLGVRLAPPPAADAVSVAGEQAALLARFAPFAAFLTLMAPDLAGDTTWSDENWRAYLTVIQPAVARYGRPLLIAVPPGSDAATLERVIAPALLLGCAGVAVCGGVISEEGGRLLGRPTREASLRTVQQIRALGGAPRHHGGGRRA